MARVGCKCVCVWRHEQFRSLKRELNDNPACHLELGWERNGYVFYRPHAQGIESALSRAIRLWYDYPREFRELILNGMRYDYSWSRPGADYLNIYDYIRYKR